MEVVRFHWNSPQALQRIKEGKPVVLQECPLVYPSFSNWTLDSIAEMIHDDFLCDVYVSSSSRFPYWDLSKNTYQYAFCPPTEKRSMTFGAFLEQSRKKESSQSNIHEKFYLQQSLVAEMGPKILDEYTKFSLQTAAIYKTIGGWDEMTHNLLLCGEKGFITPVHFDEQENLFTQLQGKKRIRLFAPEHWNALYPYPNGHPQDRQSQVTLPSIPATTLLDDINDRNRFPRFPEAARDEYFVDLDAGEVLYIPQYWFHQMEGLESNISLSWWFKRSVKKNLDYSNINLSDISLTAVRRNIEGLLANMVGQGKKAQDLFLSIASGETKLTLPLPDKSSNATAAAIPAYCTTDLIATDIQAGSEKLTHLEGNEYDAIVAQAIAMLSALFPKDYAPGFLLQVVSGRFNVA